MQENEAISELEFLGIEASTFKDLEPLLEDILPDYFKERRALKAYKADDGSVSIVEVFKIFKIIKQLITLFTYHNSLIGLKDQYFEGINAAQILQFGLDLFSHSKAYQGQLKELFKTIFGYMLETQVLQDVVEQFTSEDSEKILSET